MTVVTTLTTAASKPVVSIIGIGNMGGGIATNLLQRGYPVQVHDIDASKVAFYVSKGAVGHIQYAQAAIKIIVTIVCVVDAEQTHEVLFGATGIARSLPVGHAVMLCPTIAPEDIECIAERLTNQGVDCIDAPMSGGPARAADGSMSLMVACLDAVFAQHSALLNDVSSLVFRISQRPGDGARTKLVNNLLAGINLAGAAECLALAERMGLNLATTLAVIEQSSGQSWIGSDRMRRALAGDTTARAYASLLAKDTRLAMAAAHAVGYAPPVAQQASAQFSQALASGLGQQDDSTLFGLERKRSA